MGTTRVTAGERNLHHRQGGVPPPSWWTCGAGRPFTFTGSALTPCTAVVTGAGGLKAKDVNGPAYTNNMNAGTATANATFGGDGNHTGDSGTSSFSIGKATSTVAVTCRAGVPFNGSALTPCTAPATGVGMSPVNVNASLVYTNNMNVGTATASALGGVTRITRAAMASEPSQFPGHPDDRFRDLYRIGRLVPRHSR